MPPTDPTSSPSGRAGAPGPADAIGPAGPERRSRAQGPRPGARPVDLLVSEALEVAAISLALALVVKLFLVEIYEIPSGSMQPTLLGDPSAGRHDRIVADKTITLTRGPRRWEVAIFRHPLDEGRLYVKRVLGLPGETLAIRGGDLWIDGALAVKPDAVADTLLKLVHPDQPEGWDLRSAFSSDDGVRCEGTRAEFATPGRGVLTLRRSVRDAAVHGCDPAWGLADEDAGQRAVADLEVAFDLTPGPRAERLELIFESDHGTVEVDVPVEGSRARPALRRPPRPGAPCVPVDLPDLEPAPLRRARTSRLLARHVDRRLLIEIDGREWLRQDAADPTPLPAGPRRALLRIALTGGGRLEALRLRRDVFYLPSSRPRLGTPDSWQVPAGAYFVMGDNTADSHDSRSWSALSVTLPDGTSLRGHDFPGPSGVPPPDDANPRPRPDGRLDFTDTSGQPWTLDAGTLTAWQREPSPFVPARLLLGKPTAIVWPPDRWGVVR